MHAMLPQLGCPCQAVMAGSGVRARAGPWGRLMGRSCTMLRLLPRQVKVRKGFDAGGFPAPAGTDRMDSFACHGRPPLHSQYDWHAVRLQRC